MIFQFWLLPVQVEKTNDFAWSSSVLILIRDLITASTYNKIKLKSNKILPDGTPLAFQAGTAKNLSLTDSNKYKYQIGTQEFKSYFSCHQTIF